MRARPTPRREAESQRHVALARALHRLAHRAGLAEFSARRAAELIVRSTVRPSDTDVLRLLARQREERWRGGLDDLDPRDLQACVRAIRRAAARDGEPPRAAGRKKRGARVPPDTRPDRDLGQECRAHDLAAMSDGLDAIIDVAADALVASAAQVEVTPDETDE